MTTEDFDELSAEKELEDWRKEQWQRNCHYSEKVRHGIIKLQVDNLRDIINMVVLPLFMNPKDERKKEWYSKVYAKEDSVFTDYISLLNVYDVEIIPDDDLPYLGWYLYSASEGFYRESTGEYEYPLAKHYEEYKQALYDSLDYYEEELSKALFPEKQKDTAPDEVPELQNLNKLTEGTSPVLRKWKGGKYKCCSLERFIKDYQKLSDYLTPALIRDYLISDRSGKPYTDSTIEQRIKEYRT